MTKPGPKYLLGHDKPWEVSQFNVDKDGKVKFSDCYLSVDGDGSARASQATIWGVLMETSSPRITAEFPACDLSEYDALVLDVAEVSPEGANMFTVAIGNEVPAGRQAAVVSWECRFLTQVGKGPAGMGQQVVIPFKRLKPFCEGKPKPDAEPLDLKNVKTVSLKIEKSHDNYFSIVLNSISASLVVVEEVIAEMRRPLLAHVEAQTAIAREQSAGNPALYHQAVKAMSNRLTSVFNPALYDQAAAAAINEAMSAHTASGLHNPPTVEETMLAKRPAEVIDAGQAKKKVKTNTPGDLDAEENV